MKLVYLNDAKIPYEQAEEYFAEAAAWASRQCLSFIDYHVQDVSDFSYLHDHVAQYQFNDPQDALMFQLKYKDN